MSPVFEREVQFPQLGNDPLDPPKPDPPQPDPWQAPLY